MIERAVCLKLSLTAFLATFHAFRQHDSTFWSNDKDQAICGYKKWHLQATQELMCYQTFLSDFSAYRLSKTVIQHFEISLAVFQIAGQSHSLTVSAVPVSTYQAAFDVSFLPAVPAPSTSTTFDLLNGAEEADGFSRSDGETTAFRALPFLPIDTAFGICTAPRSAGCRQESDHAALRYRTIQSQSLRRKINIRRSHPIVPAQLRYLVTW